MKKILALIAAVFGAYVFNYIFNTFFRIIGLPPTNILGFTAWTLNILISLYIGYRIYKKFANAKDTKI